MSQDKLTLGSLFDGSGGFPLGGVLCGIEPKWKSEIESFAIAVTNKHFPSVKHYGDVSSINGAEVEPVDIITFGSPCQDLSVAGKRAGLEDGIRSNLFYQAIRIIKEMRSKTNGEYPRYIVWENVPGAFSSNKGEDFRSVLEAVCSVKEPEIHIPQPQDGKWTTAGEIVGNGYSVCWRTLDAQYFGVPQRRRRIYLVADFASECCGKILFESEGVSRHTAESCGEREGTAGGVEACLGAAGFCTEHSARARSIGYEEGRSPTLRAGTVPATLYENHSQDTRYVGPIDTAPTVSAIYGMGGNNQPFVVDEDSKPYLLKIRSGCEGGGKGALIQEDKSATLSCNNDQTLFEPCNWDGGQVSPTLTKQNAGGNQRMPDKDNFNCVLQQTFGICAKDSNSMKSDNPHSGIYEADTSRTLDLNGGNPNCNQGGMAVVEAYALQGSMIGRKDENGPQGNGINEDVCFTLDAVDRHAVYCMTTGEYMQVEEEKSPTLLSRDYKDPNAVNEPVYGIGRDTFNQGTNAKYKPSFEEELVPPLMAKGPGAVIEPKVIESQYSVRRLTPTECARLQGFPDDWCHDLGIESPTEEDISFWFGVFETYRKAMGSEIKPKSRSQIIKWLNDPYSDAAEYKLWGNGVALPCVIFVLSAISFRHKKSV